MSAVRIPDVGRGHDELLAEMDLMRQGDVDWRGGRTWSMVYHGGDAHHAFLKQASNLFFSANGLNPLAFKSLKRMEAQVVRMSADMLHAPADAVGTMTSGGTESILMAVKAARDYARRTRPWIRRPEIVAPKTLHVAFDKACHYFGLRRRNVPVDENWRVDVKALEKAITRNTVLIAASAPQYVNGSVDPIEEIGAIAAKRKIPFHVDACFGGFILPWLEDLGHPLPVFDFRVPGVTSMSADVHKYGYAPKGSSVVIYRSMRLLRHQFFVTTDWPGGIYISPSMQGSRSGAMIAAAWASMMAMGRDGYRRLAGEAMAAANQLREGIAAIDGIEVLGLPHSTVVTWAASDGGPDVYAIADRMESKGWSVDRQQYPASVHCTVNASNGPVVELYLSDLAEAVAYVRAHPEASREGDAALYGMMARVPVRGLVKEGVLKIMEQLYGPDSEEPDL
ncbi:MAG: aspartate aminotransferase family protein, partial [Myxococcales bacterium]|nr:aspartate aminotransferase family protein [Myxococcales bacterium]